MGFTVPFSIIQIDGEPLPGWWVLPWHAKNWSSNPQELGASTKTSTWEGIPWEGVVSILTVELVKMDPSPNVVFVF